jgi:HAD superfamily hydrolase (TIGR01484 family)
MIKLLAIDYDGTLLSKVNEKTYIDSSTLSYLKVLSINGVKIGVVSGRPYAILLKSLKSHGVKPGNFCPSFLICKDTYVYWEIKGSFTQDIIWNKEKSRKIFKLMPSIRAVGAEMINLLIKKNIALPKNYYDNEFGLYFQFQNTELAANAKLLTEDSIYFVKSIKLYRNRNYLYITSSECGKEKTLQYICKTQGIRPNQVLAIGNSHNDMGMLDGSCGFTSAATNNAEYAIKNAVINNNGMVSAQNFSCGILDILKKFQKVGLKEGG